MATTGTIYPNSSTAATNDLQIAVPTLSALGMVSDSAAKFDRLLAHAFAADYNQTYVYPDRVTSMSRIIQEAGGKASVMLSTMQSALLSYFNKYYSDVTVDCSIAPNVNPTISNEIIFQIVISVSEAGSQSSYGRLITTVNSKMKSIANMNNYGI